MTAEATEKQRDLKPNVTTWAHNLLNQREYQTETHTHTHTIQEYTAIYRRQAMSALVTSLFINRHTNAHSRTKEQEASMQLSLYIRLMRVTTQEAVQTQEAVHLRLNLRVTLIYHWATLTN